jgi:hypothetical protein
VMCGRRGAGRGAASACARRSNTVGGCQRPTTSTSFTTAFQRAASGEAVREAEAAYAR